MGLIGRFLLALGLLAAGAGLGFYYGRTLHLTCQHVEPAQVDCQARKRWLGFIPYRTPARLSNVTLATSHTVCFDEGCNTEVVLTGGSGELKLENSFVGSKRAGESTSAKINQFIASQDPSLTLVLAKWESLIFGLPFGMLPILVGGGLVFHGVISDIRASFRRWRRKRLQSRAHIRNGLPISSGPVLSRPG